MTDQTKTIASELEDKESLEQSTSKSMKREASEVEEECRRERLKRHRKEMAARVCIPDAWGKESMLKDWTDFSSVLESSLVPKGLSMAQRALAVKCRSAAK